MQVRPITVRGQDAARGRVDNGAGERRCGARQSGGGSGCLYSVAGLYCTQAHTSEVMAMAIQSCSLQAYGVLRILIIGTHVGQASIYSVQI